MEDKFNRDKTYCSCSKECPNKDCHRNISKFKLDNDATVWYCDFNDTVECSIVDKNDTVEEGG